MRVNAFVAQATGISRRTADKMVAAGRIIVNGTPAALGQTINDTDTVSLDSRVITPIFKPTTIMINKPVGYVCSRNGQGSKTIYSLLPSEYHYLKPIGRLDKNSSGLLLLTSDGQLANKLTHPRYQKDKIYKLAISKPLSTSDKAAIEAGVKLEDGVSKLRLRALDDSGFKWEVTISEGRNRQIRRTFEALGYNVQVLHRVLVGPYALKHLPTGKWQIVNKVL